MTTDPDDPAPGPHPEAGSAARPADTDADVRRRAEEKRTERHVWWYLAYFLFGIHLVAFVMIYAVRHGK
ncbi:hypothetical protein ACFWIA_14000 [Streptomyces sp. NPDC127068]|uniref:hypothetical protein n=1 Tax=Streptomyces sp. NPDC127068 TaxID=3347127 RepID=UPI003661E891